MLTSKLVVETLMTSNVVDVHMKQIQLVFSDSQRKAITIMPLLDTRVLITQLWHKLQK